MHLERIMFSVSRVNNNCKAIQKAWLKIKINFLRMNKKREKLLFEQKNKVHSKFESLRVSAIQPKITEFQLV